MQSATRVVHRGEYAFAISVSRTREGGASGRAAARRGDDAYVVVTRDGRHVDAGRLERFSAEYMASRRYLQAYRGSEAKPVGRVGSLLVGPDAMSALLRAMDSARADLERKTAAAAPRTR